MIIICLQIIIWLILNIVILNAKASMSVDASLTHTFLTIFYDVSAAFAIRIFCNLYVRLFPVFFDFRLFLRSGRLCPEQF